MRERRRGGHGAGFTLPELMVVAFLSGVVLFLIAQLLVPSAVLFQMQTARADVHQGALVFTHWVNRNLANSLLETVTILPWPRAEGALVAAPTAISFRDTSEGNDPFDSSTGVIKLPHRFQILWFDETSHRVMTRQWPPSAGPMPTFDFDLASPQPSLPPSDLSAICRAGDETERVLVKNVESLVITDEDNDVMHLTPPLTLTITCAEQGRERRSSSDRGDVERFTMTARVTPRNVRW